MPEDIRREQSGDGGRDVRGDYLRESQDGRIKHPKSDRPSSRPNLRKARGPRGK